VLLLTEYHEELEIDLHRQGIDLLDVWRGRLSLRRLELAIRHLPASSALVRAVDPDAAAMSEMPPVGYVLMDFFDLFARAKFQNPKPYPRPADVLRERQRAEALERQRDRANARRQSATG
jgi:hypothetical protein